MGDVFIMHPDLNGRALQEAEARLATRRAELTRVIAMIVAASDAERRGLVHRCASLRSEITVLELLTDA